jgi:hypothetical protein
MWNWIKRRELIARHPTASDAPAAQQRVGSALRRAARVPARYAPLYEYLVNRYADSVFLTFSQIEDLLGGTLPATARGRHEWWTSTSVADRSSYSDAWILAGRTARPNLLARTVAFERRAESVRDSRDVT